MSSPLFWITSQKVRDLINASKSIHFPLVLSVHNSTIPYTMLGSPEDKFFVLDQPHSKLITFSYLIGGSFFQGVFGKIRYELVVKLCIKLMTNSLQAHTKSD
jgi:hypothetical protein